MIKAELAERVAEEAGTTIVAAEKWINAILSTMGEVLAEGEEIVLMGFGKFVILPLPDRKIRNPLTGDITVEHSGYRIKFLPAERIKRGLNHIGFVSFD